MFDMLWGKITNIVDDDSFDVQVARSAKINANVYPAEVRVRFAATPNYESLLTKEQMEKYLLGKKVELIVQFWDVKNRLVCGVKILQQANPAKEAAAAPVAQTA
ncbi:MAG TPA: hypothetical protein PK876_03285 [Elusimicrobiota bacterium]|nr:hypothetical protein [Elusimicrobiota bacterium]